MNASRLLKSVWMVALGVTLFGCEKNTLDPLQRLFLAEATQVTVKADFCTENPNKQSVIHILVPIIDFSGSTQANYTGPGTDENGYRRFTPLKQLLTNAPPDPNSYYGFIRFDTTAAIVQTNGSNLTNDPQAFLSTINYWSNPGNLSPPVPFLGGWTNYLAALQAARDLATAAINQFKVQSPGSKVYIDYIWVSDGAPLNPDGNGGTVLQSTDDIVSSINSLLAIALNNSDYAGNFSLSTGYFYNVKDPVAANVMNVMANTGHGLSLDFAAGQAVDWQQYSVAIALIKHSIRSVMVWNMNTVWEGPYPALDSDGDGIPDDLEVKLGSDPKKFDSDGNGVSDGVEYRLNGKPCADAKCSPLKANSYLVCQKYELTPAPNRTFSHSDGDKVSGLDDCAKYILGARTDFFDSNNDGLTDQLKFYFGLPFVKGATSAHDDPDKDGVANFQEVMQNTPPFIDNSQVLGIKPINYQVSMTSSDAKQDCFHVEASPVTVLGRDNNIKLIVMEEKSLVDPTEILRTAVKRADQDPVIFQDDDLK